MRGRWVGLVGPWLFVNESLSMLMPQVTKTGRNGNCQTWYHESINDAFQELLKGLQVAFCDDERGECLRTGIHWLIESYQCAGGVEGSIVLQQAAIESMAWFEIVQVRKICSDSGFEKLPAADKIRWLTSLYSIPTVIPYQYAELTNYAKAFSLKDIPDVLVDVRNALIHGTPKKVRRLFDRPKGNDERTDLWWLTTGLLEQVVLAIAGYRGRILRRDLEVRSAISAVRQVPWVMPSTMTL